MKSKRFPIDSNGTQNFGIVVLFAVTVIALGTGTVFGISIGKKKG